jgi:hypothetical protein
MFVENDPDLIENEFHHTVPESRRNDSKREVMNLSGIHSSSSTVVSIVRKINI